MNIYEIPEEIYRDVVDNLLTTNRALAYVFVSVNECMCILCSPANT